MVVVVTYYRIGRLEGGQLALVVVEAMFVQRDGRLGRHGGGVRMAAWMVFSMYVYIILLQQKRTDWSIDGQRRGGRRRRRRRRSGMRASGQKRQDIQECNSSRRSLPSPPSLCSPSQKAGNTERYSARHSQSTAGRSHAARQQEILPVLDHLCSQRNVSSRRRTALYDGPHNPQTIIRRHHPILTMIARCTAPHSAEYSSP